MGSSSSSTVAIGGSRMSSSSSSTVAIGGSRFGSSSTTVAIGGSRMGSSGISIGGSRRVLHFISSRNEDRRLQGETTTTGTHDRRGGVATASTSASRFQKFWIDHGRGRTNVCAAPLTVLHDVVPRGAAYT